MSKENDFFKEIEIKFLIQQEVLPAFSKALQKLKNNFQVDDKGEHIILKEKNATISKE